MSMRWPAPLSRSFHIFKDFRPLLRAGIDLVFPSQCASCGEQDNVQPESMLCTDCWQKFVNPTRVPLPGDFSAVIEAITAGEFTGPLRDLILRAKYSADSVAVVPLVELLIAGLRSTSFAPPHLITQVPADRTRLRKRGFYLPSYIARKLSRKIDVPHRLRVLTRQKTVAMQSSLPREARLKNLEGVFRVEREVKGQNILVIDDVITTGATASAAARVLLEAGAHHVTFLAIARTPLSSGDT